MNWKKIFVLGLLFSLSPFYIRHRNYLLHYSILGEGMILLSFYYLEKMDKIEVLSLSFLTISLIAGITNQFVWQSFFYFVFLTLILSRFFKLYRNIFIQIVIYILIFSGGVIIPIWYYFINVRFVVEKLLPVFYLFIIANALLAIFSRKDSALSL